MILFSKASFFRDRRSSSPKFIDLGLSISHFSWRLVTFYESFQPYFLRVSWKINLFKIWQFGFVQHKIWLQNPCPRFVRKNSFCGFHFSRVSIFFKQNSVFRKTNELGLFSIWVLTKPISHIFSRKLLRNFYLWGVLACSWKKHFFENRTIWVYSTRHSLQKPIS